MSESDKSGKPELTTIPIVVYDPKPEAKALLQTNEPMIVVCGLLNQLRAARQTTQIESEFAQARIAELEAISKALIKTLQVSLPIVSAPLRETFEIAIAKAKDKLLKP